MFTCLHGIFLHFYISTFLLWVNRLYAICNINFICDDYNNTIALELAKIMNYEVAILNMRQMEAIDEQEKEERRTI